MKTKEVSIITGPSQSPDHPTQHAFHLLTLRIWSYSWLPDRYGLQFFLQSISGNLYVCHFLNVFHYLWVSNNRVCVCIKMVLIPGCLMSHLCQTKLKLKVFTLFTFCFLSCHMVEISSKNQHRWMKKISDTLPNNGKCDHRQDVNTKWTSVVCGGVKKTNASGSLESTTVFQWTLSDLTALLLVIEMTNAFLYCVLWFMLMERQSKP